MKRNGSSITANDTRTKVKYSDDSSEDFSKSKRQKLDKFTPDEFKRAKSSTFPLHFERDALEFDPKKHAATMRTAAKGTQRAHAATEGGKRPISLPKVSLVAEREVTPYSRPDDGLRTRHSLWNPKNRAVVDYEADEEDQEWVRRIGLTFPTFNIDSLTRIIDYFDKEYLLALREREATVLEDLEEENGRKFDGLLTPVHIRIALKQECGGEGYDLPADEADEGRWRSAIAGSWDWAPERELASLKRLTEDLEKRVIEKAVKGEFPFPETVITNAGEYWKSKKRKRRRNALKLCLGLRVSHKEHYKSADFLTPWVWPLSSLRAEPSIVQYVDGDTNYLICQHIFLSYKLQSVYKMGLALQPGGPTFNERKCRGASRATLAEHVVALGVLKESLDTARSISDYLVKVQKEGLLYIKALCDFKAE